MPHTHRTLWKQLLDSFDAKLQFFFMESYMKPHLGEQGYNYVIPHVYREN